MTRKTALSQAGSCRLAALLLAGGVLLLPCRADAVPAAPVLHELRQPDGTAIAGQQWGDEFLAGWETPDNYTIIADPASGEWRYAGVDRCGELIGSPFRVGRDRPHGILKKRLRPKRRDAIEQFRAQAQPGDSTAGLPGESPPFSGAPAAPLTRNIPVILINFSDTTSTYTPAEFESLLFGTGTWSMKEYYEEVSFGAFSVSTGPTGVTAWVTAGSGHDYYGQPSGWGPPDAWPGDLAYEAVQQADSTIDFSPYDNDGDCVVDTVAIVHQGPAQEASGNATDIWSHSWSLSSTYSWGLNHYAPSYTTDDRCLTDSARFVTIDRYIMQPETLYGDMTTVGVFAHEYGHSLGLVDLYDSDSSSEGVGNWSLMGSGSWGGVTRYGDRPTHLDPWSKVKLGWVTPARVMANETGRSIPAVESSSAVYQFLPTLAEGGSGEYLLLENRQKIGFDAALPGDGLLLWHIDELMANNKNEWYPGCTACTSHYKVAVVPADNRYDMERDVNRGDSGDTFPGSTDNRTFTFWTAPASTLYDGTPAGFTITAISSSGPEMTADLTPPDRTPPVSTITSAPPPVSTSGSGSFSFGADEPATFSCRLDGGAYLSCTSPFNFSGLSDANHTFDVRATDSAGNQETTPASYSWTVSSPSCNVLLDGACHATVRDAYDAIPTGTAAVLLVRAALYTESLTADRNVTATIEGGYDDSFAARTGTTAIQGTMTLGSGTVIADGISLQ